jgi:hypothetical protein
MVDDPQRCAAHYNRAVETTPEAGIGGLAVAAGAVELPLWRIDSDGRRQRAFDRDAKAWLDNPKRFSLLPRALTMTALLRLGACDVFIHGFGGARYDPAMERWMASWLDATPQPIVMVSASLRLPLESPGETLINERAEQHHVRQTLHDPAAKSGHAPSAPKAEWIQRIDSLPRRSVERKQAFLAMHDALEELRSHHADALAQANERVRRARQQRLERDIVERRTWPFPFYPRPQIDAMANETAQQVTTGCSDTARTATSVRSPAQ